MIESRHSRTFGPWRLAITICVATVLLARVAVEVHAETKVKESVWYDADADAIRPVPVEDDTIEAANRTSRWSSKPSNAKKTTPSSWFWQDWNLWTAAGWLLLGVLFAALVAAVVWVFRQSDFDFVSDSSTRRSWIRSDALDEQTQQRIAQLPAAMRDTKTHPKQIADERMQAGDYGAALIYLFGHQLLLLDKAGWLRLTRGKTNRRYVGETKSNHLEASEILNETVTAFERSYFGQHPIGADPFARLWQRNEQLESLVAAAREIAA
ncbi:MAG: DUF4129 domain-containing protein [Planctomycetota bacterium]